MTEPVHIVISADSLALPRPWNQKNLDQKPASFFKVEDTYPQRVRQHLCTAMPEREVIVSAFAARGSTMGRPAKMTKDLFDWLNPTAVVIHHGVVDCWERPNGKPTVALEDFKREFDAVVEAHADLAPAVPLIAFSILPTNKRMLDKYPEQNKIIDQYNDVFRVHKDSQSVHIIDVPAQSDTLAARAVHEDGHHLSRFGHELYASKILSVLSDSYSIPRPYFKMDPDQTGSSEAFKEITKLINVGDKERAGEAIEEFDRNYGDSARGRYAVGRLYNQIGDAERAFRSLAILDNADGERLNASALLGIAAYGALDARAAIPFLQKAYFSDPSSRAVIFRLGKALEAVKRFRDALRLYDQFLSTNDDADIRLLRDGLMKRGNADALPQ